MNRKQRRMLQAKDAQKPQAGTTEEWERRAASELHLGHLQEAKDLYDQIIAKAPANAGAFVNRAIVQRELKHYNEALADYDQALSILPNHPVIYNNRGVALQDLQRFEEALASCSKAIALKADYAAAYNNCGTILYDLKRCEEAVAAYDKAIALEPDYADAWFNRGMPLRDQKRFDDALASYDKAIALKPTFGVYNNRSMVLQDLKRYKEALASCDKAIEINPAYAEAYQNRGNIMADMGDMQEAERMFRKALEIDPSLPDPMLSLAGIHKYRDADQPDIKAVRNALVKSASAPVKNRDFLFFALGKMLDDCKQYDEAFECYREGNALVNRMVTYNPQSIARNTDHFIEGFSKDFLAQKFSFASGSLTPIFIVGMPRSGTTLMASILSNHPAIGSAGELPAITDFTIALPKWLKNGASYPQAAHQLTPELASRMIHEYEARLRRDIGPEKPHVIDKHPMNFRQLGLIAMLFPHARILHCMRDPMDTCLSNYFQRFALDYSYAFDLKNIGHYYGEYERLMAHWREALPIKILDVKYEDMTSNTEATVRKMLEFLEVAWDEHCLSPHTNKQAVETASKWQVRQPIYKQSVARWRHYETHLGPLKEALISQSQ